MANEFNIFYLFVHILIQLLVYKQLALFPGLRVFCLGPITTGYTTEMRY